MSADYVSIKEDVLKKLEANLPEIRERFGIETIGIFGSVDTMLVWSIISDEIEPLQESVSKILDDLNENL